MIGQTMKKMSTKGTTNLNVDTVLVLSLQKESWKITLCVMIWKGKWPDLNEWCLEYLVGSMEA